MPAVFVRSASASNGSGASSISVIAAGATAAGNALFVSGNHWSYSATNENVGGTYTSVASDVAGTAFSRNAFASQPDNQGTGNSYYSSQIWSALNAPAGTHTATANTSESGATTSYGWVHLSEFSGVASANAADRSAAATGYVASGTQAVSATTPATATADELVLSVVEVTNDGGSGAASGISTPSGSTLIGESTATSNGAHAYNLAYRNAAAAAAQTVSWGGAVNAGAAYAGAVATFRNATVLYPRDTATGTPNTATQNNLLRTQGAASATSVTTLAAGNTTGIQTTKTAGGAVVEWISDALQADVSIAGPVTVLVNGLESAGTANSGVMARLYHTAADGTGATQIGADAVSTEWGTAVSSRTLTVTPGSPVAVASGRRLLLRLYAMAAGGTMAAGSMTVQYGGAGNFNGYVQTSEFLPLDPPTSFPAPAVLQSASGRVSGTGNIALTLNGVAAGSVLVVCVSNYEFSDDGLPNSITSSPSLSFTSRVQSPNADATAGSGARTSIWTSGAASAGNYTVTLTYSSGYSSATVIEVANLDTAALLNASASAGGTADTQTPVSGTTAATTAAKAIAIASLMVNTSDPDIGIATPSGYTNVDRNNDASGPGVGHSADYRVLSATGTQSASWGTLTNPNRCTAAIVVLKGTGSALASTRADTATASDASAATGASAAARADTATASDAAVPAGASARTVADSATGTDARAAAAASPRAFADTTTASDAFASAVSAPATRADTATASDKLESASDASFSDTGTATEGLGSASAAGAVRAETSTASEAWAPNGAADRTFGDTGTASEQFFSLSSAAAPRPIGQYLPPPPAVLPPLASAAEPQAAEPQAAEPVYAVGLESLTETPGPSLLETLPPTPPPPSTGSAEGMVERQAAVLPPSWFGPPAWVPAVLRLPLAMAAEVAAWIYALILFVRRQSRIKSAEGGFLDLIALDFYGARIRRKTAQDDESFRRRILLEMFRPRNTRPAMIAALKDLTGREPRIYEPARPADSGGIGIASSMGMGVAGAIGSLAMPGEVFIDVYRTPEAGIAFAAGIGASVGGIGVPSRLVMSDLAQVRGALTEEDIRAAVVATKSEGIRVWMRVLSGSRQA